LALERTRVACRSCHSERSLWTLDDVFVEEGVASSSSTKIQRQQENISKRKPNMEVEVVALARHVFYLGVGSSWKCQLWRTLHDRSIAAWLLAVPLLLLLLLVLVSVDLSFGCFCYYHYFLKHCVEATRTSPSLGLQAMILFSCPLFSFLVARFHVMYQAFLRPSTDHAYPAHLSWIKSEMRWSQLHCCMVVNLDRTDKLTWDRINLRSKPIRVEKKNLINLVKHSG